MASTAARPLLWVYAVLIVYASLYPFEGWRDQGIAPWAYLSAPLPKYWTGFDVVSNVLGYAPLGFLLTLVRLRSRSQAYAVSMAVAMAACLSLCMEAVQSFLPMRVPSNLDALLNILGALTGAVVARVLMALGWLERWSRFRARWFVPHSSGALALLATWPLALMFPAPVPFGLGQVLERLEDALAQGLMGTPWLEWLPLREVELQPLLQINEVLCIGLGALLPVMLAYSVVRQTWQRAWCLGLGLGVGIGASALSAVLTYGPEHTWEWLTPEVYMGVGLALTLGVLVLKVPARMTMVLTLTFLVWQLGMLNNASADVYFSQTLQTWEQGRFIRFHGLIQWLGWLWPYGLLMYLLWAVGGSSRFDHTSSGT